jgi:uncharacterized damage-inducible protein DinB
MSRSLLEDACGHHVWAAVRLIDVRLSLSPEQLETVVPGTYGSILQTQQHVVGSDSWYLFTLNDDRNFLSHHGNDHRSQICTALTNLGLKPPAIYAWDFGLDDGRVVEITPSS